MRKKMFLIENEATIFKLIVIFIGLWFLLLLIASAFIVVFLVTDPARSDD